MAKIILAIVILALTLALLTGCIASPEAREDFFSSGEEAANALAELFRTQSEVMEDGVVTPEERERLTLAQEMVFEGFGDFVGSGRGLVEGGSFDWNSLMVALSTLFLGVPISIGGTNMMRNRARRLRGEPVKTSSA